MSWKSSVISPNVTSIMPNADFRQLRINLVPSSNQLLVSHVSIVCFWIVLIGLLPRSALIGFWPVARIPTPLLPWTLSGPLSDYRCCGAVVSQLLIDARSISFVWPWRKLKFSPSTSSEKSKRITTFSVALINLPTFWRVSAPNVKV